MAKSVETEFGNVGVLQAQGQCIADGFVSVDVFAAGPNSGTYWEVDTASLEGIDPGNDEAYSGDPFLVIAQVGSNPNPGNFTNPGFVGASVSFDSGNAIFVPCPDENTIQGSKGGLELNVTTYKKFVIPYGYTLRAYWINASTGVGSPAAGTAILKVSMTYKVVQQNACEC